MDGTMPSLKVSLGRGWRLGLDTTWMLVKITLPVYVAVSLLGATPVLRWVARACEPLMGLFGLPGEAAMVLVVGNALNLYAAIGAMKALQQKGLSVPRDLSVTGFDNTALAEHSTPPLTTINVPRKEMGRWAARSLIGSLQKPQGTASRIVLKTDLVIRESVTSKQ